MSGDTLVYDMSSMSEGTPQVFVKKDWLNILDNQNGNYAGNQSVIDTSQLANSNKYMNYREAYLAVPLLLTATSTGTTLVDATQGATSADLAFGLKNWFGSIIHSFTLDYNGTTIVQQTPYVGMWNTFRLMTTLSYQDVITNGATMGFYPDDALSWGFTTAGTTDGIGTYNNQNRVIPSVVTGQFNEYNIGNIGFLKRQQYISYDPDATPAGGLAYSTLFDADGCKALYKSYISQKQAQSIQWSVMATIQLKHIHNFFQNVPLLKGVFMKMTMNLNQSSLTITSNGDAQEAYAPASVQVAVNSPLGGVSPLMVASKSASNGASGAIVFDNAGTISYSIAVGSTILNPTQKSFAGISTGQFSPSIALYVPAYTFNPTFEDAYLSNPVKNIVYTDVYQYQVLSVAGGQTFNNLITNGIANIKSVLIIPFFTASANGGLEPYQSPFDPAGCGATSPLALLTNFNVVVAGQNMIYNTQRYSFEQFLNQLQGCNAVNANMTDGLTSSLINQLSFEQEYCHYYVNCSRMLPVDEAVPKSVQIIGQNKSKLALNLFVFVEYGVQVSVDVLTGARV